MTKIEVIPFGGYSRPQFPECPRANFEKHPAPFINNWTDGTPVVMCRIGKYNHTCEWRHKTDVPESEQCPYGTVY